MMKWNSLKGRIIEATPLICLIIYLFIGFVWHIWHPTWVIFFLIPIMPTILSENLAKTLYPLICVVLYLVLGFTWHLWHPAWLLFLTIPVYYILFRPMIKDGWHKDKKKCKDKKDHKEFIESE